MAQMVKNLPAMQEIWVWSLGWKDSAGEGNGYLLQYCGLENSWTEEPGRLQSMGSQRVRHDWVTFTFQFQLTHRTSLEWKTSILQKTSKEWEDKSQTRKKIFEKTYLTKDCYWKREKELLKPTRKWETQLKHEQTTLTDPSAEIYKEHRKRNSTSYVSREMHIVKQWDVTVHLLERPKSRPECSRSSHSAQLGCKQCSHCGDGWAASYKTAHSHHATSHHTPWYLPKGAENMSTQKPANDVYSSFIHNCPNLETTKMSFNRWMDEETVVHWTMEY